MSFAPSTNTVSFDKGNVKFSSESISKITEDFSPYFNHQRDIHLFDAYSIRFADDAGYYLEFMNKQEAIGSILVKGDLLNQYSVQAIYEPGFKPFKDNERFCVNPFEFKTFEEASFMSLTIDYSYLGVTYSNNIINKSNYLGISDIGSKVYTYASSYLNESKIQDVPNYMNTQFNNNGCSPTTAAMYFAYLEDNGYAQLAGYRNLPLKHTSDRSKVDSFIKYVGGFFGTNNNGTDRNNIPSGYISYFETNGIKNIKSDISKNYMDFDNSIRHCALPVHVSIGGDTNHSVLGIGRKEVLTNQGANRFIIANFAYNNSMSEVSFTVDIVRQFYFNHF